MDAASTVIVSKEVVFLGPFPGDFGDCGRV